MLKMGLGKNYCLFLWVYLTYFILRFLFLHFSLFSSPTSTNKEAIYRTLSKEMSEFTLTTKKAIYICMYLILYLKIFFFLPPAMVNIFITNCQYELTTCFEEVSFGCGSEKKNNILYFYLLGKYFVWSRKKF